MDALAAYDSDDAEGSARAPASSSSSSSSSAAAAAPAKKAVGEVKTDSDDDSDSGDDDSGEDREGDGRLLLELEATGELAASASRKRARARAAPPCEQCGAAAKYTCPGCAAGSCSAACVRAHKDATGCSGRRDRAAAVPAREYGEAHLLRDYAFLEEAGRSVGAARRLLRGFGTMVTTLRVPVPGGGFTAQRGGAGRGRGGQGARGGRPAFETVQVPARVPAQLHLLLRAARAAGVNLRLMPRGFKRREDNSSRFVPDRAAKRKRRRAAVAAAAAAAVAAASASSAAVAPADTADAFQDGKGDGGSSVVSREDDDGDAGEAGADEAALEAIRNATDAPHDGAAAAGQVGGGPGPQPESANNGEDGEGGEGGELEVEGAERGGEGSAPSESHGSTMVAPTLTPADAADASINGGPSAPMASAAAVASPLPAGPPRWQVAAPVQLAGRLLWRLEIEWPDAGGVGGASIAAQPLVATVDTAVHDAEPLVAILRPYLFAPPRGLLDPHAPARKRLPAYCVAAAEAAALSAGGAASAADVLSLTSSSPAASLPLSSSAPSAAPQGADKAAADKAAADAALAAAIASHGRLRLFFRVPYAQAGRAVFRSVPLVSADGSAATLRSALQGATVVEYPTLILAITGPEDVAQRFPAPAPFVAPAAAAPAPATAPAPAPALAQRTLDEPPGNFPRHERAFSPRDGAGWRGGFARGAPRGRGGFSGGGRGGGGGGQRRGLRR
jgi:hypothetical protein